MPMGLLFRIRQEAAVSETGLRAEGPAPPRSCRSLEFSSWGLNPVDYSGFDSALYRNVNAKWHFPQENATTHDPKMAALESKPL